MCELAGYQEASERARVLLSEHEAKLAEARHFLADRHDAIQGLQAQLTQKDAQASGLLRAFCRPGANSIRQGPGPRSRVISLSKCIGASVVRFEFMYAM